MADVEGEVLKNRKEKDHGEGKMPGEKD